MSICSLVSFLSFLIFFGSRIVGITRVPGIKYIKELQLTILMLGIWMFLATLLLLLIEFDKNLLTCFKLTHHLHTTRVDVSTDHKNRKCTILEEMVVTSTIVHSILCHGLKQPRYFFSSVKRPRSIAFDRCISLFVCNYLQLCHQV